MPSSKIPSTKHTFVPSGKYLAVVTNTGFHDKNKDKKNYLDFEYQIIKGPFKGRKIRNRHVLRGYNYLTLRSAVRELSAIGCAIGVESPIDSPLLFCLPIIITVKLKYNRKTKKSSNEIIGWEPIDTVGG